MKSCGAGQELELESKHEGGRTVIQCASRYTRVGLGRRPPLPVVTGGSVFPAWEIDNSC